MVIVDNGPDTINRGVRTLLFDASVGALLPGLFSGKIRPQSLPDPADTVLVELVGRTTGNVTEDTEVSKVMKATDLHFYITPLQAFLVYKIFVTLENTSVSLSAPLDFEINRSVI